MHVPNYTLSHEFTAFEPLLLERFHNTKKFSKHSIIINLDDDRSKFCYYILQGTTAFNFQYYDGNTKLSTYRGTGSIFPLYYTFESTIMESTLEVTALTDVVLLQIPKPALLSLMKETPDLAIAMIDAYAKYATILNYDIASHLFETINVRICDYLYLSCFAKGNETPVVNQTQEEIGSICGVTRSNVSRVISKLRQEGIIQTNRHSIEVLSKEKLLHRCSCILDPRLP